MPVQRDIVEGLAAAGLRERVKVMACSFSMTENWAAEIEADVYAENAVAAVDATKKALAIK
jgi:methanogenic corrinoid protein MtbC1